MSKLPSIPLAATVPLILAGCALLESIAKPEVKSVQPHITGADLEGLDMVFDVGVQNPYPVPITASKLKYRLDVEGSRLIVSETDASMSIPASGRGTVKLPARISFADIAAAYSGVKGKPEVGYTLHGAASVTAFGKPTDIPINHSGKLPIVRPPKFSDVSAKFSRSGLLGAKVDVKAQMTNPNAFEIGVDSLRYGLKFGDAEVGGLTASSSSALAPGATKPFAMSGSVSAGKALMQLMAGAKMGQVRIVSSGAFTTPYGRVKP